MIEAMKRAYADRARYLGDPAFVDAPTNMLLVKDYAAKLRAQHRSAARHAVGRDAAPPSRRARAATPRITPSSIAAATPSATPTR